MCVEHGVELEDVTKRSADLSAKLQILASQAEAHAAGPWDAGQGPVEPHTLPAALGPDSISSAADMDDDLLDAFAEVATRDDDPEGGDRAERIAAVKARLKAKRGELAKKLRVKSLGKS